MFHEVTVNILEMKIKTDIISRKIQTLKKSFMAILELKNVKLKKKSWNVLNNRLEIKMTEERVNLKTIIEII